MPKPSRTLLAMAFTLVFVLVAGRPAGKAAPTPGPALPIAAANLDSEKKKGEQLVQTLHIEQAMGPLAPVALSPFFALTCLSGASLLADTGLLPDGIKKNPILGTNSALNNPFVFAGLLALTVITALPKLTKVSKPLGQAVDQIEAHAGIISVVAVQFLSTMHFGGDEPTTAAIVYQAGIFSFTGDVLVAVLSAINIFVINTVKFFFEVLIWLSPFPMVDAAFETANKTVAAGLLAIYVISPWVAMILNVIIFALCLLIFAWVHRRVVYMRSVLGDPVLGWFAEKLFRRKPVTPTSTPLPASIATRLQGRSLVLKAFAGKPLEGIKRKARGYLVQTDQGLFFAKPRLLRSPRLVALGRNGPRPTLNKGLLSNTVTFIDAGDETIAKFIITRRYNSLLGEIRSSLGVSAAAATTEPSTADDKAFAASRAIGAAAKAAGGRDEFRAEFA